MTYCHEFDILSICSLNYFLSLCAGGAHAAAAAQVVHLPVPRHGRRGATQVRRHGVNGGRGGAQRHLRAAQVGLVP